MVLNDPSVSQRFCAETPQNIKNGGAAFSELLFLWNEKKS